MTVVLSHVNACAMCIIHMLNRTFRSICCMICLLGAINEWIYTGGHHHHMYNTLCRRFFLGVHHLYRSPDLWWTPKLYTTCIYHLYLYKHITVSNQSINQDTYYDPHWRKVSHIHVLSVTKGLSKETNRRDIL